MVTFFVIFLNASMILVLLMALSYHYYKRLSQNKLFQTIVFKLHAWIKMSQSAGVRKRANNNTTSTDYDDMEMELEMDDFSATDEKCMLLIYWYLSNTNQR